MRYREVARKLRQLGCVELPRRGKASHQKCLNPTAKMQTVVPDWGHADLKVGTIRAIVKQLGLVWKEFEAA